MLKVAFLITILLSSCGNFIPLVSAANPGVSQAIITPPPTTKISPKQFMESSNQHPTGSKIIVSPLTLEIWQDDPNLPPSGISPTANRQIGFASLSFTLENKTQQRIALKLQKIEILPLGSEHPLMSLPAKNLTLGGLEYAPQRYQLSNKQGYGNVKKVEAVVVYQLDGKQYTLRSAPVRIP